MTSNARRNRSRIRFVCIVLAFAAFAAFAVLVGIVFAAQAVPAYLATIETWVAGLGFLGVLLFVGLYVILTSAFLPEPLLAVLAGPLFGLGTGMVAITVAGLCAGAVQYLISRRLLGPFVQRRIATRPKLAAVRDAVLHDPVHMQVLLRFTPIGGTWLNYITGASGVGFRDYLLASPAMLPSLLLVTYFGHAADHLVHLAGEGSGHVGWHVATILVGLVASVLVVTSVSRRVRGILAAEETTRT